jgi:hypothetical protein
LKSLTSINVMRMSTTTWGRSISVASHMMGVGIGDGMDDNG